jgi:type IV secretory pathway TraG/TraD family ATPase VirD4
MARSLVPEAEGESKKWSDMAKTVVAGILEQCRVHGIATNHALASLTTRADPVMLAMLLEGHPAHAIIASGSPQTVGSIITTLVEAVSGLRYLNPDAGADAFSISEWIKRPNDKGWLFLPYQLGQREALKNLIAAQLDVVARTVLDLPENEQRRIWLIIDEAPLLGRISSLTEFLTNGRRFGGCAVIGIQAASQLIERYGREGAQTLLACLSSQLILRAVDHQTADMMSRQLGDKEVTRRNKSQGKNDHGGKSTNEAEQVATTRVVMPSELQKLKDLEGYFNLPGMPVAKIKLEIPEVPAGANSAFIPREMPPRRPFVLPDHLLPEIDDGHPHGSADEANQNPDPQPIEWPADDLGDWRNL